MTSGAFSARRNLTHFTASFSDLKASHPPTVLWFITSSLVGVFTEKPCTRFWETSIPLVVEQICSIQPLLTQSRWSGGNALFSQMQPFTYQPPCAVATYVIQISLFCFHQSALSPSSQLMFPILRRNSATHIAALVLQVIRFPT